MPNLTETPSYGNEMVEHNTVQVGTTLRPQLNLLDTNSVAFTTADNASNLSVDISALLQLTPVAGPAYVASGTTTFTPATSTLYTITTATGASNFAVTTTPPAGTVVGFLITNDGSAGRTITFTTNFKPSATLVGTTSKVCVIFFVSDGTNLYEAFRAGAAGGTAGM